MIWGHFAAGRNMYDKSEERRKVSRRIATERCREQTKRVQEDAQLMEQMLIAEQTADRKEFGRLLKDLRQMQNNFDHEFLVSKEDQEFHSTYDTILRLGMKALNASDQKLLLQSEIENLLALLKGESGKRGTGDCGTYILLSVGIGSGTSTAATSRKTGKNYIFL